MTRRWLLIIAAFFGVVHGWYVAREYQPNTWLFADAAYYFKTVQAIADRHELDEHDLLPQSWYVQDLRWNRTLPEDVSTVALGRHGEWYPKHPLLLSIVAVPFYWAFGIIGTLVLNVAMNLLFFWLTFLLARRFVRADIAALFVCLTACAPIALFMSYAYSNDLLGAILVLGALECTLSGRFGWAGVLAGLSIWPRVTDAIFLPAFVIIGLSVGGWKQVLRAATFALIPLSVFGAFNTWCFGAPWITSYQVGLVRQNGVLATASHAQRFNVPFLQGLRRIMLQGDGLIFTYPLLVPGVIGIALQALRRRAVAIGLLVFLVLPCLLFLKYQWFRPHMLYMLYGLAAPGLAMLAGLVPTLQPQPVVPERPLSRMVRFAGAAALIVFVVASVTWRKTHPRPAELLSSHIEEADVRLGEIPCDLWNPDVDRWECYMLDGAPWSRTGRLYSPVRVKGEVRSSGLWLTPGRQAQRIVRFPKLPGRRATLTFALDDDSKPVDVQVKAASTTVVHLARAGDEQTVVVDLAENSPLELSTQARDPDAVHLIVEGELSPR